MSQHKKVRITEKPVQNSSSEFIGWNFKYMAHEQDFEYNCSLALLDNYINKLIAFEGYTLGQIRSTFNNTHAWDKGTSKFCQPVRDYIEKHHILIDQALFQLKLGQKQRLFGFIKGNIFHVVFLDVNHTIYEMDIK